MSTIFGTYSSHGEHSPFRLSKNRPPKGGSALGTHLPDGDDSNQLIRLNIEGNAPSGLASCPHPIPPTFKINASTAKCALANRHPKLINGSFMVAPAALGIAVIQGNSVPRTRARRSAA